MSSSTIGDPVLAGDARDLGAPRFGHHAAGRVVDGRHQVHGAGRARPAGVLEGVGAQAVLVDGKTLQPKVEQAGHRLEAGVGQLLGQAAGRPASGGWQGPW